MPIPITCDCGRSLRAKDELAGRKVRCPDCGAVLVIPQPSPREEAEDEASKLLLAGPPEESGPSRPNPGTAPGADEGIRRQPPAPLPPRPTPPAKGAGKVRTRRARSSRRESRGAGFGIAIHPEIIAGVLMMAGAAVWFLVRLNAGFVSFYPIILFFLGIGAVVRGFTGES